MSYVVPMCFLRSMPRGAGIDQGYRVEDTIDTLSPFLVRIKPMQWLSSIQPRTLSETIPRWLAAILWADQLNGVRRSTGRLRAWN